MRELNDDPRAAFVRSLPRKIVEVKATLGAVIADPTSGRMRDELRRRISAFLALARSYRFPTLADALRTIVEVLDQHRQKKSLEPKELEPLVGLVASLAPRAEFDAREESSTEDLPTGTTKITDAAGVTATPGKRPELSGFSPLGPLVTPGEGLDPVARALGVRAGSFPALSRALSGALPASALQILAVGAASRMNALAELCAGEVEVVVSATLDEALARAKETAPDVVVAECAPPADGIELVRALRAEPLTDFIPAVLIAPPDATITAVWERCHEAHDVLNDEVTPHQLRRAAERAVRGGTSLPPPSPQDLGELSLDELVRALQDEIKRGLSGAATPQARVARVSLGTGSEVLAATWDAITRIRDVVQRRSDGAVRFELPAAPRGLPGTEVFTVGRTSVTVDPRDLVQDPLPGHRAIVVDDDPTVTEQFSAILRDAGMEVFSFTDGDTALREARRLRPDVVVSDILMPGLDGFGLCRAIRRDVVLRNTPVILISWREDLLARMRELGARAAGYLRKEAPGEAILSRVRAAIRLRVRSLQRVSALGWGAVFRGRLERVGVVPLIETAARALGDATVTLTDAASVTQLSLRGGALVSVSRTLQDGALVRGEPALLQALGTPSGRVTVERSSQPVREDLSDPLGVVLERCAAHVEALESALEGAALLGLRRIDLDPETALAYARTLPVAMRSAVERLVAGDAPRELVRRDGFSPKDLEPLLTELVRRGAVQKVIGSDGRDVGVPSVTLGSVRQASPLTPQGAPIAAAESPRARVRTEPGAKPGAKPGSAVTPATPVAKITQRIGTGEAPPVSDSLADVVWRELREAVEEPQRKARETLPVGPSHLVRDSAGESWSDIPDSPAAWAAPSVPVLRGSLPDMQSLLSALPEELPVDGAPAEQVSAEAVRTDDTGDQGVKARTAENTALESVFGVPISVAGQLDDVGEIDHGELLTASSSEQTTQVAVLDAAAVFASIDADTTEPAESDRSDDLMARLMAEPEPTEPEPTEPEPTEPEPTEAEPMLLARRTGHTTAPPAKARELAEEIEEVPASDVQEASLVPPEPEPERLSMSDIELVSGTSVPPDGEPTGSVTKGEPAGVVSERPESPESLGPRAGELSLYGPSSRPPPAQSSPPATVRPSLRTAAQTAATRSTAPTQPDDGSWWLRPLLLLVLVGSAFVISYIAVYFVTREAPSPSDDSSVSSTPVAARLADGGESVESVEPARVEPFEPVDPVRVIADGGASGLVTTSGATRDAVEFLDGGTLDPGQGMIVVRPPRRGSSAVDVSIDQQPAGRAPLVLRAPAGFHRVRFRVGIITSFQTAMVHEGQATVLDPPSDQ